MGASLVLTPGLFVLTTWLQTSWRRLIDGTQPADLTAARLRQCDLPMAYSGECLGFRRVINNLCIQDESGKMQRAVSNPRTEGRGLSHEFRPHFHTERF